MQIARWKEPILYELSYAPVADEDWNTPQKRWVDICTEAEHFEDEFGRYLYSEIYRFEDAKLVEAFRGEWDRKRKDLRGAARIDLRAVTRVKSAA